ncbi:hypothetical protein D0Z00_002216 [Geotrichum galactomycetum]|uniref:Uncharacterized protein n=1 Tax=Geotrichum galactomycetum TaxID=27317 RepID=A0ACB6V4Y6_9ASCO|nr:hypothetical protein D0Z00_002216 [Geotrichum candidum]
MLLPTPAVSTGSTAFTQMSENNLTSNNEPDSNNGSNNGIDAFETSSKENIENENSYEDDSDDDSEDMPIFYSSLTTTLRTGTQTPSLPLVGLMQPHGSSTPKEHANSLSPASPATSDISNILTRRNTTILLPSSPSSRQVSLPRKKTVLEPGGSLHVSNLDPTAVTEAILYNHFCAIGPVSSVKICRDAGTSRSLGYGYVNYYKRDDARRAMEVLNFLPITHASENKVIRIAKVFAKGQPPPAAANVVVKGLPTTNVLSSQGGSSARDIEDDKRSSPYRDRFSSRRYHAGQHRQNVQEQHQQHHQELNQLEYQSQYPPLPDRPEKYSHATPPTLVTEPEPKFTNVPSSQPLSQDSAHWYIWHIPRPYVYFPMSAESALLGFESRLQSTHAGATSSSIDSAEGHATLVGHYYFGIDADGVGYHVQHPMPPPVPASLLLQSESLKESGAKRVEAAESGPIDKMGWEKETLLKIQPTTLQKDPLLSAPETSARVVGETAIMRRNSTPHLSNSSTHRNSGIRDKSPTKLFSPSLPSPPGLNTEALVLPGLAASSDPALKPLRLKTSVSNHNNQELMAHPMATKAFSPPLRTFTAEGNSSLGTGGKIKVAETSSGSARLYQHTPLAHVDQSSGSSNPKGREDITLRHRRKFFRGRRHNRRANRAVPAVVAGEK